MTLLCEMKKKTMRLKEELKTWSSCHVTMSRKILSWLSKLCHDRKTRHGSQRSKKHYRWKNNWSVRLRCQDGRQWSIRTQSCRGWRECRIHKWCHRLLDGVIIFYGMIDVGITKCAVRSKVMTVGDYDWEESALEWEEAMTDQIDVIINCMLIHVKNNTKLTNFMIESRIE